MTSLHDSSRSFAHVSPLLSKFETIIAPHTLLPEAILISSDLTPDALLKLSLLTWYFNTRGDFSQELLQFITELDEFKEVYQHYMSYKDFIVEIIDLLRFIEGKVYLHPIYVRAKTILSATVH
ncbi:hypothetical protein BO71DRAFT_422813 [Aspergillus ellipticus CBS 707.79]|uniref:Uncharacterized protein n=1 Tax=Aspergillus ellipticus CBS 707.79 TaxID=1448320 RepID=A0A319D5D1_9EURO|nr:hypothetical protein BO71DRAFT_422813 [Aspergillus ellipticus CBS 707.79]